jgi:hypothetical protein
MIDEIPNRVLENGTINAFGRPPGFVMNLNPDHAVRYDRKGTRQEELKTAIRLNEGYLRIR